ncbi:hypothetical protein SmJEL517_g00777 [Synchytrium microbalum]|uniref:SAC domain-containing protein n=1 Tax=Synchytrium microbalum TaxID=1806994 RepID=A0A507CHW0_9FUNG|nr:uncharacterized protein SmJEL517_g00777 [Synchytrium microbalum]TPX37654.1 hypothetical protein SmJEL517_g00777 [Synchytrium microbalum]
MVPVLLDNGPYPSSALITAGMLRFDLANNAVEPTKTETLEALYLEVLHQLATATAIPLRRLSITESNLSILTTDETLKSLKTWLQPIDQQQDIYELGRKRLISTRTWIIDEITSWASSSHSDQQVYWLSGVAGSGKSVVAASAVDKLETLNLLAASFFCKHNQEQCNDPSKLVASLAYQFAMADTNVAQALTQLRDKEPDFLTKSSSVGFRFEKLIVRPLMSYKSGRKVVVIDALDEAAPEGSEARNDFFRLLGSDWNRLPTDLLLFVTSRPLDDIKENLSSYKPRLIELNDANNIKDIELYAHDRMSKLIHRLPDQVTANHLAAQIANMAQGLFVWLHLACEQIRKSTNPVDTVKQLAENTFGSGDKRLDTIYSRALLSAHHQASDDDIALYSTIMGAILALKQPMGVEGLSVLVNLPSIVVKTCLARVESLLIVRDNAVQVMHKSVADFLTSSTRCTAEAAKFYINTSQVDQDLAYLCLKILNENLRYNIIALANPFKRNVDIEGVAPLLKANIPDVLRYACIYFQEHLPVSHSPGCKYLISDIVSELDIFLSNHLLEWLEVLSYISNVPSGLQSLTVTGDWMTKVDTLVGVDGVKFCYFPSFMGGLIDEAQRFIKEFYLPITTSALHIYYSALPFCPKGSYIYKRYYPMYRAKPFMISVDTGDDDEWSPCLQTLEGHYSGITTVAGSRNGRYLVSGAADGFIIIWNENTGALDRVLPAHTNAVSQVIVADEQGWIISASLDYTVKIWDLTTGTLIHTLAHDEPVTTAVLIGNYIYSGSKYGTLRQWDISQRDGEGRVLEGHIDSNVSLSFAGNRMLIVSSDGILEVRDSTTNTVILTLRDPSGNTTASTLSKDAELAVIGSGDLAVRLYDLRTGELFNTLYGHNETILSVVVSSDKAVVVSAAADMTIRVWNGTSGVLVKSLLSHTDIITSMTFSSDGFRLISGSEDETIKFWHLSSFESGGKAHDGRHESAVLTGSYSGDERKIVTGSYDTSLKIWDVNTNKLLTTLTGHRRGIIWIPLKGSNYKLAETDVFQLIAVLSAAFLDENRIVSSSSDATLRVWNSTTGEVIRVLEGHTNDIWTVRVTSDNKFILSGSNDTTMRLWSATSYDYIRTYTGHTGPVRCVAFSPDNRRILSAASDCDAKVWDLETGKCLATLEGHTEPVWSCTYSPNGKLIVTGAYDETISVWNSKTFKLLRTRQMHSSGVRTVAFSPDSKYIVSGSYDKSIIVWNSDASTPLAKLTAHAGPILNLTFSNSGKTMLSSSWDCTTKVWDVGTWGLVSEVGDDFYLKLNSADLEELRNESGVLNDGWLLARQYMGVVPGDVGSEYTSETTITFEPVFLDPTQRSETLVVNRENGHIRLNAPPPPSLRQEEHQTIYGLIGTIGLNAGMSRVGKLLGKDIFKLTGYRLIPVFKSPPILSQQQTSDDATYRSLLDQVLGSKSFYFSYAYDLTHTLQRQAQLAATSKKVPMWKKVDVRFFWNSFLQRKLIDLTLRDKDQDLSNFILPIICGFVEIQPSSLNGRSFTFGLISRRSHYRAGTRYNSRGIDDEGNVSNFVETEQLVILDEAGQRTSFVQTRGSIPLYWKQITNVKYTPKLEIEQNPKTPASFKKHFADQIARYGNQVAVNLVNSHGYESRLGEEFAKQIKYAGDSRIKYIAFDFHQECRKMQWHRISLLVDQIENELNQYGYTRIDEKGQLIRPQMGIVRTNCMDCLDRTNVVQSVLARRSLTQQLRELGILSAKETVEETGFFETMFKNVWADNADEVSRQYSGTGALKTDFTRTGKRSQAGLIQDGLNSVERYIRNNFFDGSRQDAYDFFLGLYEVRPGGMSPFTRYERDLKYYTLPAVALISLIMTLASLFFIDFDTVVSRIMYSAFWTTLTYGALRFIVLFGKDFVARPTLVRPKVELPQGVNLERVDRSGAGKWPEKPAQS